MLEFLSKHALATFIIKPITITEGATSDEIRKCLEVTPYVPVVDSNKHVIAIAMERK